MAAPALIVPVIQPVVRAAAPPATSADAGPGAPSAPDGRSAPAVVARSAASPSNDAAPAATTMVPASSVAAPHITAVVPTLARSPLAATTMVLASSVAAPHITAVVPTLARSPLAVPPLTLASAPGPRTNGPMTGAVVISPAPVFGVERGPVGVWQGSPTIGTDAHDTSRVAAPSGLPTAPPAAPPAAPSGLPTAPPAPPASSSASADDGHGGTAFVLFLATLGWASVLAGRRFALCLLPPRDLQYRPPASPG